MRKEDYHKLYDRRWRKRREQQLRAEPLCELCMKLYQRVTPATICDHVTPHKGDAQLFEGAVMSLCKTCHDSIKKQMESGGKVKGCDVNGRPIDPGHHWNTESGN